MRISDSSSDVCSSDLHHGRERRRADVGGEAGAQQVDRDKGHYGGVEESEDCNHSGQQRGEPEKAADGAEIHAVEPGGAAMPERQDDGDGGDDDRSEEHTSELQSLMRNSSAVFCLKKKNS